MLSLRLWAAAIALIALADGCGRDAREPLRSRRDAVVTAPATLLKDLNPSTLGSGSSSPSNVTRVGDRVFFVADDGHTGNELWVSDGTEAGTVLVRDVKPGLAWSDSSYLTAVGSQLYFRADDGSTGAELWTSDGTPDGTHLVKDLTPGPGSSSVGDVAALGGSAYFFVTDTWTGSSYTSRLYRTDGTEAGTTLVRSGSFGGTNPPYRLFAAGGALYFFVIDYAASPTTLTLWKSDGTDAGTAALKTLTMSTVREVLPVGNAFFFVADDPNLGTELFRCDGTANGTGLVKDLVPGAGSGSPRGLTELGGRVLFSASDPTNGFEPWISDGTDAGTVLVKDVLAGSGGGGGTEYVVAGNRAFFISSTATPGQTELWVTDGTGAGTARVMDLGRLFYRGSLAAIGTTAYLGRTDGSVLELWTTDGTQAGSVLVKSVPKSAKPSQFATLTVAGTRLYFTAGDSTTGEELWTSDGTAAGTVMTRDLRRSAQPGLSSAPFAWSGGVLFAGNDPATGSELWKSDGTPAGTVLVKDLSAGARGSNPTGFLSALGTTFFTATVWTNTTPSAGLFTTDGTDAGTVQLPLPGATSSSQIDLLGATSTGVFVFAGGLFKTDGTPGGTVAVTPASGAALTSVYATAAVGGTLYFSGYASSTGWELWKTDGTNAGTALLKDISAGSASGFPDNFVAVGSTLYFTASDPVNGQELWKTTGTAASTVLVKDVNPGAASSNARGFKPVGANVLFAASSSSGFELWKIDAAGAASLVKDIAPGAASSLGNSFDAAVAMGGNLYFAANDGTSGVELWRSDGTAAGTVRVKDLAPGAGSSSPSDFTVLGSTLYFFAQEPGAGRELWKTDGTASGTALVKDLIPGPTGGGYAGTIASLAPDEDLVLAASDATGGYELWRSDGTAAETMRVADLVPGPGSPFVGAPRFVKSNGSFFFGADDGVHGYELWAVKIADLRKDFQPPTISCPGDATAEATSPAGATVTFAAATATDDRPGAPTIGYSQPPGSTFALGQTTVTATATDAAGNTAQCALQVTVTDTVAPVLACPADVTAEATSTAGAAVTYPAASATDAASATLTPVYSAASGATFAKGKTTVDVTVADASGNGAACSFAVTVQDTTPPALTCAPTLTLEATSAAGATAGASDLVATASDAASPPATTTVDHAAGFVFPLGTTDVTWTARDDAGNEASCVTRVVVKDSTAPVLTCPGPQTAEASSAAGADVSYPAASATDAVDAAPSVTYDHGSGTTFALGKTAVVATAKDAAGNEATCSFEVEVRDTTAPTITCPQSLEATADSEAGAAVSWADAQAGDTVTAAPAVGYSAAPGSVFAVGKTTVTATAKDGAGNSASCTFEVSVLPKPPAPVDAPAGTGGCGCSGSGTSALAWGAMLLLAPALRRRRAR